MVFIEHVVFSSFRHLGVDSVRAACVEGELDHVCFINVTSRQMIDYLKYTEMIDLAKIDYN